MTRVVVYGATGRAGQRIARELAMFGARLVVAGRNERRVMSLAESLGCEHAVAPIDDSLALQRLVARGQLLVNCAGPFTTTALPLARACIHAGAHYLDVSGERKSVEALLGLDAEAHGSGVVVLPAAGAKGALGVWAACLAFGPGRSPVASGARIDVAYAHAGSAYWRPTVGALRSIAGEGLRWEAARPLDHGPPPRTFPFPTPFARGLAVHVSGVEEVVLPWVGLPDEVRCHLAVDPGTLANVLWGLLHHPLCAIVTRPAAPRLWQAVLTTDERRLTPALPPARPGTLAVVVERGVERIAVVTRDGYAATTAVVAMCARRLLGTTTTAGGVIPITTLVDASDALADLVRGRVVTVLRGGRSRRSRRGEAGR